MRRWIVAALAGAAASLSLTGCGAADDVQQWCENYDEQMTILVDRARTYKVDPELFEVTFPITRQGLGYLRAGAPNEQLRHALDSAMADWATLRFSPASIASVLAEVGLDGDPVVVACDRQGVQIG